MERIVLEDFGFTSRHPRYVVVMGLGDGAWLLDFFLTHSPTLKSLILIEPDPHRFRDLLSRFSWTPLLLDSRVHWYIGEATRDVKTRLLGEVPEIASWGIHAWKFVPSDPSSSVPIQPVQEWLTIALQVAHENSRIQIERGLIIQSNIIQNLPAILRSMTLQSFTHRFLDVPAVIIGAGPSLNRNIEELKLASPGTLLISTDTALRPLLNRGIHPHFVVACDPLKLNHRHFQGIPSLENAILAYLPETNAAILDQYAAHPRLLCLHDLQSKLLQRIATFLHIQKPFQRRMNVGYCAFMLARDLGCSPIILAGMDLAVSPGGMSHAEGTANISRVEASPNGERVRLQGNVETGEMPLVPVEGYDGETVYTFTYFAQILRTMQETIADCPMPIIDATEGGARKRGAVQMPLREALKRYANPNSLSDRLSIQNPSRSQLPLKTIQTLLSEIQQELHSARSQLQFGLQRIQQWNRANQHASQSPESFSIYQELFLSRWLDILNREALDTGMDIGLARWRYATWRVEPPEPLSMLEQSEWWSRNFQEWFSGLARDLDLFIGLYTLTQQRLQKQNQQK